VLEHFRGIVKQKGGSIGMGVILQDRELELNLLSQRAVRSKLIVERVLLLQLVGFIHIFAKLAIKPLTSQRCYRRIQTRKYGWKLKIGPGLVVDAVVGKFMADQIKVEALTEAVLRRRLSPLRTQRRQPLASR
jgi:hypothetical protein